MRARTLDAVHPPRNFGVSFANGFRERSWTVYHASRSECGRGRKAGAPSACIDNARAIDPDAGFLQSGVEFCRRKRRRRPRFDCSRAAKLADIGTGR
jgi:hypothetical protein